MWDVSILQHVGQHVFFLSLGCLNCLVLKHILVLLFFSRGISFDIKMTQQNNKKPSLRSRLSEISSCSLDPKNLLDAPRYLVVRGTVALVSGTSKQILGPGDDAIGLEP